MLHKAFKDSTMLTTEQMLFFNPMLSGEAVLVGPCCRCCTGTTVVLQLESLGEAGTLPRLNAGHMNGGLGACDGDTLSKNRAEGCSPSMAKRRSARTRAPNSLWQVSWLFMAYAKNLYVGTAKMLGFLGSRWGFRLRVLVIEGRLGFGALGFRVWGVSCRHLPKSLACLPRGIRILQPSGLGSGISGCGERFQGFTRVLGYEGMRVLG